jgi:hypothetical protein
MSLLHPSPGQIIDRLSILSLKIDAYTKLNLDRRVLLEEAQELKEYFNSNLHDVDSHDVSAVSALYAVNAKIWHCEDAIRSEDETLQIAHKIAELNDYRVKLVRMIDEAYGVKSIEQKVYHLPRKDS